MSVAAILPSRNELATIAAVTTAVDTALGEERAVIVHADSSDTPDTARRFATTPARARKVALTGLVRGKGTQILAAARRQEVVGAEAVLIADTDTRNSARRGPYRLSYEIDEENKIVRVLHAAHRADVYRPR